jgi:hypothetical protein
MNNKSIIFGILAVAMIAGIAFITTKNNPDSVGNIGIYCSLDGTLSDTMPIQSHRSYCVKSDASGKSYFANMPSEYSFSIVDDQGNTLRNFEITHTKPMHVIVVRKDLKYFQHIHPEFDQATGQFTLKNLMFPADGQYRIFADFAPSGGQKDAVGTLLPVTISEDLAVGSAYTPEVIGTEERTKTFDGYQTTLSTDPVLSSGKEIMLTFDLKQNGKSVTDLQEYLGALGHSVILKEGTLDFIHAHPVEDVNKPQTGKANFMVSFPEAGKYKVFTQFQRAGKVSVTDFVLSVAQGVNMPGKNAPDMDHSVH